VQQALGWAYPVAHAVTVPDNAEALTPCASGEFDPTVTLPLHASARIEPSPNATTPVSPKRLRFMKDLPRR
jgi:hypothetical protein